MIFTDYYGFISEVLENEDIYKLFEESDYLYRYLQDFVKMGIVNRLYLVEDKNLAINNQAIQAGPFTDNEETIKLKFINYVDSGEYKGEERNYVGNKNNKKEFIDLKSGKSLEEIEHLNHSRENFEELLNAIANKNYEVYEKKYEYYRKR